MSNNSNGPVTPLSRSRRVASIPTNISNVSEKPLNGDNEYKNDYNIKNSNKINGKSENLFNFVIAKDLEHFKNG